MKTKEMWFLSKEQRDKLVASGVPYLRSKALVQYIEDLILGKVVSPVYPTSGWGQYADYSSDIKRIFKILNIKLREGNEAPRKGRYGMYYYAPDYVDHELHGRKLSHPEREQDVKF